MPISIEKISDTTFIVTVEGRTTTTHTVTVSPEYREELAGPDVPAKTLVRMSFEFLLEGSRTRAF